MIDTRSKRERKRNRIPHSIHIHYKNIEKNLETLQSKRDQKILVYCAIGHRSRIAAKKLAGFGFENVYNIVGGLEAFRDHQYKIDNSNIDERKDQIQNLEQK